MLPFLTPRYAVRAAEIMTNTPAENVRAYDDQIRRLVDALTGELLRRTRSTWPCPT